MTARVTQTLVIVTGDARDDASKTVTSILWLEVDSLCAYAAVGLPMPNDEDSVPLLDVLTVARAVTC